MNKLVREVGSLPFSTLEMFANECGIDWADPDCLMELQAIIIEEVIDKDVDASNAISAFYAVKDSVAERWTKWLHGCVSYALDV